MINLFNPYIETFLIALIIIISFIFSEFGKKSNFPNVILLIILGYGIKTGLEYIQVDLEETIFGILELLGIIGVIMIVLEGALEIKLSSDKKKLALKAFFQALLGIGFTSLAIAWGLSTYLMHDFLKAYTYALPLAVISSSIVIPAVKRLNGLTKDYLIYESTLSDIFGILVFYLIIDNYQVQNATKIAIDISANLAITSIVAIIAGFALVVLVQKIGSDNRIVLLIAILMILYATGKLFHISSFVIILVFGLLLRNHKKFFRGRFASLLIEPQMDKLIEDFHFVTRESVFLVRTFFFVVFGMTINIKSLLNLQTAIFGVLISVVILALRFMLMKIFRSKTMFPETFIAPRGLITILLLFSIPTGLQFSGFDPGIVFYVILITSLTMTLALNWHKNESPSPEKLEFELDKLDEEIEKLKN